MSCKLFLLLCVSAGMRSYGAPALGSFVAPAPVSPAVQVNAPSVTRCIALSVPELGTVVRPNIEKNLDRATVIPRGWVPVGGGASDSGAFVVACGEMPPG